MKKKYFPSPSKQTTKKLNPTNKNLSKRIYIKDAKIGKSLRKEFDHIIKTNYSMLTVQDIKQLWHIIGTQLAQQKTHTGSLKTLIIDTLRLNNNSH